MASFSETDFQICLLCKEMCGSPVPLSSNSSASSSSSQTSTSSGGGGGGPGAAARRLHVLPCLHAFCRPCLEAHRVPAAAGGAPGEPLKLRCPVCDQKVVLAEAAGMDALPSSAFLLSNLLDAVVATADEPPPKNGRAGAPAGAGGHSNHRHHAHHAHPRASASAPALPPAPPTPAPPRSAPGGPAASPSALLLRRPHGCSSCDEGNAASSRCLDCQEHLCDNCVRAHQRVRLTKDHYIERGPPGPAAAAAAAAAQQLGLGPSFPGPPFSILFPERLGFCQHHDDEVSVWRLPRGWGRMRASTREPQELRRRASRPGPKAIGGRGEVLSFWAVIFPLATWRSLPTSRPWPGKCVRVCRRPGCVRAARGPPKGPKTWSDPNLFLS